MKDRVQKLAALVSAIVLVGVAAPASAKSLVIENVRIEVGDGSAINDGTVLIEEGRIKDLGKAVTIPDGAERIDGRGKVVAPGFVEARTHLGLFEVPLEPSTVDTLHEGKPAAPAFSAYDGFNPQSVRIPIEREEGVTTVVVSPDGTLIYGTGFRAELDGALPASLEAPLPVAMFGGIGQNAAMGVGHARGAVFARLRQIVDDTVAYKASRRDYDRAQLRELSLSRADLETMVPVIEGRIPFVLAANRASDILAALRLKREVSEKGGRLRLIIMGAAEGWIVADKLRAEGVPVIVTPSEQYPSTFEQLRARDDNPALMERAGVKVVISSYNWFNNVRRLRQEAGIAVSYGMDRGAAFAAISSRPAEVFGFDDVGLLKAGRRANLTLFSGDPLELSTVAERIFIDGEEMPLANRQRALAERYKGRKR